MPKVLVIGTNPAGARQICRAIRGCHAAVLAAGTLDSGLRRLRREPADAVLLDVDGEGGAALHQVVRSAPGTPVIAVGERDTEAAVTHALRAGAQDYLAMGRLTATDVEKAIRHAAARGDAESVLKRASEEWQRTFDAIPDMVCVLDADYRVVRANLAMARRAGVSAAELEGRRCHEILHGTSAPPEGCPHGLSIRDGLAHIAEMTDERDGSVFVATSSAVHEESGKPRVFVHIVRDITAQKRAEHEAHRSEEKFRDLVENLNDVLHRVDGDGRLTYVSPSAARVLGTEADRIVGRRLESFFVPEDRAAVRATIRRALDGEGSVGTFRVIGADGRTQWLRVSYRPLTRDGRVTGLSGVLTDVTDRRRAADALQRSYDLLDETQRLAKMGGWQMELASGRVLWSEGVYRLYGVGREYDPCDMGRNFSFFAPESIPVMARAFRDVVEHGTPYDLSLEFVRANGERIWVRTLGEPVLRRGKVAGVKGYLMDVTETVMAQKVILDADAKRKAILDNVSLGIALVGTDMRIRECSGHMELWFPAVKSDGGAVCHRTLRNPPRETPCGDCPMRTPGGTGPGCEAGFSALRDGVARQYRATASAVRDAAGNVVGAVEIVEDATERLALEERLRHQQKLEAIGTLAGGVAHEVNNPIGGIMGYAQLMVDDAQKDSTVDRYGREIIHECERVSSIVKDLLSFARQDVEEPTPARIEELLRSALALLRALIRRDGITLDVGEATNLPLVRCRKGPVRQVLMNLLTNARDALNAKYQPGNQDKILRVRMGVVDEDGKTWLRTTVEDHGTGIAPEIRARVFDPFFTTKPRDQGTGLGLSVSYGIVKEHGGRLDFESEPGQWTKFRLDLPVVQDAGA